MLSGPTHKGHNTLDLILSNVDQLPVSIGTQLISGNTRSSFLVTSIRLMLILNQAFHARHSMRNYSNFIFLIGSNF